MRFKSILLAAFVAAAPVLTMTANAEGLTLQVGVSTLGYTVEPAYRLSDQWGLRMPIATGSYEFSGKIGDRNFESRLKSGAAGLLADYRPFAGGLRLSGGLIHTDYRASIMSDEFIYKGEPSQVYANIEQKDKVSPMLALGYDARVGPATISAAAGGIFTSGFKVSGGQTGTLVDPVDVEAELSKIRKETKDIKSIPYLSVGLSFAF